MSFIEKFKSINKKNVAIVAGILFVLVVVGFCVYEHVQLQQMKAQIEQPYEEDTDNAPTKENAQQQAEPTKKPSEYKIGIPYEKAMKQKKPIITLFYADWCHYCIKFMPTYQTLYKLYGDDCNFVKINVEDPKYADLVKKIGITGFPTVFLIDPKYDNRVLLSNSLFSDMEALRGEIDRFLRIRGLLDKKH